MVALATTWLPTALQDAALVQETPARAPLFPGVGVSRRCQAVPFHSSLRVSEVPNPLLNP
jgi:hypothetical protein